MITREEMDKEIEEFRALGRNIVITGSGTDWICTFDDVTTKAATPELAYLAAKSHRQDSGPKE